MHVEPVHVWIRMTSQMETQQTSEWLRSLQDRYGGGLRLFAYRALGDWETAEEVLQDTLVRAWRAADRFDPERANAGTWLYAIARNLIIDQHRRRASRPQAVEAEADALPDEDPSALDRALEAWQVADALRQLSPDHRTALMETYYRGASIGQAARKLGVPPGTVKSRVHYALRNLRLVLEERGVVG